MKYIHVDGDDGTLLVSDEIDREWFGWVHEAPDDYQLTIPYDKMRQAHVHEYLGDLPIVCQYGEDVRYTTGASDGPQRDS